MPYRIDLVDPPEHALETLVDLGALDVEAAGRGLAALMPDAVQPAAIARALGITHVHVSPAVGRDDESVWTLSPRAVRLRTLVIVPADTAAPSGALRMVDGPAFGTGLHMTTALCLEVLEDLLDNAVPERMLDVGTGSGILALFALQRGVRRAVGLDVEPAALVVAAENARLNGLAARLHLVRGGPEAVRAQWPLVVANIRAAELMAMATTLVQRIASKGQLVLSGIPTSVAAEVEGTYRRFGMIQAEVRSRGSWTALVLRASW